MVKEARELQKLFDTLHMACGDISDAGACEGCPLSGHLCLEDTPVIEVAEYMTADAWDEFFAFSDGVYNVLDDMARAADDKRKGDRDEAFIYEEYGA